MIYEKVARRYIISSYRDLAQSIEQDLGIEVQLHGRGDIVTLSKIVVPEEKRGQGLGSSAMRKITDWADKNGVTLATTPSGDFGGNVGRLKDFYSRFGFVPNEGENKIWETQESMVRRPQ